MRRRRSILLVAAFTLSACASVQTVEQELGTLKGQPIRTVTAKLGPSTSEQKVAGGTNYAWTSQPRAENVPVTVTTTDYSTGRPNSVDTVVFRSEMQTCTLRFSTDAAGIIGTTERDGPNAACANYIAGLRTPK